MRTVKPTLYTGQHIIVSVSYIDTDKGEEEERYTITLKEGNEFLKTVTLCERLNGESVEMLTSAKIERLRNTINKIQREIEEFMSSEPH